MDSDVRAFLIITTPVEQSFRLRRFGEDGEVALSSLDRRFTHLVSARDGLDFWPLASLLSRADASGCERRRPHGGYLIVLEPCEVVAAVGFDHAGAGALVMDDAEQIHDVQSFDELFAVILPPRHVDATGPAAAA